LIFVDSNIPMYLVGGVHPHRADAQVLLERLTVGSQRLVTDAEVLQELLHRYTAVDRRNMIRLAFKVLLDLVDEVFAVEKYDVLRAAEIAQHRESFSARDAVHIAVMEHRGIQSILSFDADFDRWPGLRRIHSI
jgi:predicted nucleic acid-binding protein